VDGRQAVLSASDAQIKITVGDEEAGSFGGPIRLVPADVAVFEIVSPKVKCSRYRGILEIRSGSALSIANELPLEDYVRGVIPVEIPKSFHPEAQKALVLAIRTYALTSLGRHRSDGWDVCDTTHCQGFAGASKDAPWVDRLIDQTRGRIIVYKGEPIHAVYSTDCGGMTQNNEDAGFGDKPWAYLRAVEDRPNVERPTSNVERSTDDTGTALGGRVAATPSDNPQSEIRNPKCEDYCAKCPSHSWSKSFTAEELDRAFSRLTSAKIGKLQSLEFAEYDCSGRVKTVLVKGDQGEYRMPGRKLREVLGVNAIKSTRMALAVAEDGSYTISGRGYGHGVGLCAFGADGLARSSPKITYVDILKHYYTGVEITPISECGLRISD
jgi:stage II sporulation protein D